MASSWKTRAGDALSTSTAAGSVAELRTSRNSRWASGQCVVRYLGGSGIERVIFADDAFGIAIETRCWNGGVAVTGPDQDDADHQGAGEAF